MPTMQVDLDVIVKVEYTVDENPKEGRVHPIDISEVKLRGRDIYAILDIHHVMTLQRRIHNRLVDEELI